MQLIYVNDVNPQPSFWGLEYCCNKACFSTLTCDDYSKQWPFISRQEASREITVNSWPLKEWGCFLENSVPWGWRDQWETASLARTLGKEWCVLASWPHSKAMFSLALLSAVMVCISVPGSVQKPEGTDGDKKSDRLKWKKMKSLYKTKKSFPLKVFINLTALLNNRVYAEGVWLFKKSYFKEDKSLPKKYWSKKCDPSSIIIL